jgi:hypothetical protein
MLCRVSKLAAALSLALQFVCNLLDAYNAQFAANHHHLANGGSHSIRAAGWVLESAGVRLHKNNLVCGSKRAKQTQKRPAAQIARFKIHKCRVV